MNSKSYLNDNAEYLKILVDKIHSVTVATIGEDNHPVTRIIDMMYLDKDGLYFITAKGKAFYSQLMNQKYVSLTGVKDKISISLHGDVENVDKKNLDLIFEKNSYMNEIYPGDTKNVIEVFCLYKATGEYFDLSNPSSITRKTIRIGDMIEKRNGFLIDENCIGCKLCYSVCPQKCIDITAIPCTINQSRCLHCGACFDMCPKRAIKKYESK